MQDFFEKFFIFLQSPALKKTTASMRAGESEV